MIHNSDKRRYDCGHDMNKNNNNNDNNNTQRRIRFSFECLSYESFKLS